MELLKVEYLPPGMFVSVSDVIAEKLDEMADLCEHWKRNRDKGRYPNAIRMALLMLAEEVTVMTRHIIDPDKEKAAHQVAKNMGVVDG